MSLSPSTIAELPATSELDDDALAARVVAGDPRWFAVLVRRYNQRVFRVARSILLDEDDAEDVVQDAHVAAYERLATYRGPGAYGAWLTRITVRKALELLRKKRRLVSDSDALEDVVDPAPGPDARLAAREMGRLAEAAIDGLPPPYRVVLVMRDVEKMSTRQAAEALGLSEENVRVRLHRARADLRSTILDAAGEDGLFPFAGARCDRILARVAGRRRDRPGVTIRRGRRGRTRPRR